MARIPASINVDKVLEVAKLLGSMDLRRSNMFDTRFFPPRDADVESTYNYFLAMVAIDHRAHIGDYKFQRSINGEIFTGSDLLWRLGMEMFSRDPSFFSPRRLSKLDPVIVRDWLVGDYGPVWDYGVRAYLLRDVGIKVARNYGTTLRLFSVGGVEELLDRLSDMVAYEDPVKKKAYLLIKFLVSRGLLKVKLNEIKLPIDNHLTRIAYRLGIVRPEDWIIELIRHGIHISSDLDVRLRMIVRDAWDAVVRVGKLDPIALDDFLWRLGRTVCIADKPSCEQCPLRRVCHAHSRGVFINEHAHYLTYYY
ncbi:MAG: iron-sulfur cluster loop [Vulcanisaeta sp.]